MADISSDGKVAYIYDEATDTWYPVAGSANTSSNYDWTGSHSFANPVSMNAALTAKSGVNTFLNTSARDAAIPSPTNGVTCFVRQNDSGVVINQMQYFFNGAWRIQGGNAHIYTSTDLNYNIAAGDSGKTILIANASANTVTVPNSSTVAFPIGTQVSFVQTGTGKTSFLGATGVTINSKYGNKSIAVQYSPATIVCTADNQWLLIGDLTA
jgi:hypothetical protein